MDSEFNLDDVPEKLRRYLSPIPTPLEIRFVKLYMQDTDEETDEEDDYFRSFIEATPLFQVFSITIHGLNYQKSEIYGTIYLTNERGENFCIYCMEKDNPQVVHPNNPLNNFLLLSSPDAPIQPIFGVKIKVDLKDRIRNDAIVAQGDFVLEHKDYGEQDDFLFKGDDQYYANMHYVVFPYAIIAKVQVTFFLNDDKAVDKDNQPITVDVYGRLTACCRSNIGEDDFPSITLFDKPHDQPLKLCSGTQFMLSRSVVTLPAYAGLQIQANLNIPLAENTVVFGEKNEDSFVRDKKDVPWENGFLRVGVEWYEAHTQPYQGTKPKEIAQTLSSTEGEESKLETEAEKLSIGAAIEHEVKDEKKSQLFSSDPLPSDKCGIGLSSTEEEEINWFPTEYGEVFSVAVCSKTHKSLEVHGDIVFDEGVSTIDIFKKDISNPDICSIPCRLKSVVGPSESFYCINGFYMRLELKHENHRIGKGSICHRPGFLYSPIRWVDRRLCAVFRGHIGYAIVHYSLFSDSVQARMSVLVEPIDTSNTCYPVVSGQIFASYSEHSYSSHYEKEFYRSVLFDQDQPVSCSGQLCLLKNELPVPLNSNLIVEAKLVVSDEELKKTVKFEIDDLSVCDIKGSKYNVKVCVSSWR